MNVFIVTYDFENIILEQRHFMCRYYILNISVKFNDTHK